MILHPVHLITLYQNLLKQSKVISKSKTIKKKIAKKQAMARWCALVSSVGNKVGTEYLHPFFRITTSFYAMIIHRFLQHIINHLETQGFERKFFLICASSVLVGCIGHKKGRQLQNKNKRKLVHGRHILCFIGF